MQYRLTWGDIEKAAHHKYLRRYRVMSRTGKQRYNYIYPAKGERHKGGKGVAQAAIHHLLGKAEHYHEGASFSAGDGQGHLVIAAKVGDKVTFYNDDVDGKGTHGAAETVSLDEFKAIVGSAHDSAAKAHYEAGLEKREAILEKAKQHGTEKHIEKAKEELQAWQELHKESLPGKEEAKPSPKKARKETKKPGKTPSKNELSIRLNKIIDQAIKEGKEKASDFRFLREQPLLKKTTITEKKEDVEKIEWPLTGSSDLNHLDKVKLGNIKRSSVAAVWDVLREEGEDRVAQTAQEEYYLTSPEQPGTNFAPLYVAAHEKLKGMEDRGELGAFDFEKEAAALKELPEVKALVEYYKEKYPETEKTLAETRQKADPKGLKAREKIANNPRGHYQHLKDRGISLKHPYLKKHYNELDHLWDRYGLVLVPPEGGEAWDQNVYNAVTQHLDSLNAVFDVRDTLSRHGFALAFDQDVRSEGDAFRESGGRIGGQYSPEGRKLIISTISSPHAKNTFVHELFHALDDQAGAGLLYSSQQENTPAWELAEAANSQPTAYGDKDKTTYYNAPIEQLARIQEQFSSYLSVATGGQEWERRRRFDKSNGFWDDSFIFDNVDKIAKTSNSLGVKVRAEYVQYVKTSLGGKEVSKALPLHFTWGDVEKAAHHKYLRRYRVMSRTGKQRYNYIYPAKGERHKGGKGVAQAAIHHLLGKAEHYHEGASFSAGDGQGHLVIAAKVGDKVTFYNDDVDGKGTHGAAETVSLDEFKAIVGSAHDSAAKAHYEAGLEKREAILKKAKQHGTEKGAHAKRAAAELQAWQDKHPKFAAKKEAPSPKPPKEAPAPEPSKQEISPETTARYKEAKELAYNEERLSSLSEYDRGLVEKLRKQMLTAKVKKDFDKVDELARRIKVALGGMPKKPDTQQLQEAITNPNNTIGFFDAITEEGRNLAEKQRITTLLHQATGLRSYYMHFHAHTDQLAVKDMPNVAALLIKQVDDKEMLAALEKEAGDKITEARDVPQDTQGVLNLPKRSLGLLARTNVLSSWDVGFLKDNSGKDYEKLSPGQKKQVDRQLEQIQQRAEGMKSIDRALFHDLQHVDDEAQPQAPPPKEETGSATEKKLPQLQKVSQVMRLAAVDTRRKHAGNIESLYREYVADIKEQVKQDPYKKVLGDELIAEATAFKDAMVYTTNGLVWATKTSTIAKLSRAATGNKDYRASSFEEFMDKDRWKKFPEIHDTLKGPDYWEKRVDEVEKQRGVKKALTYRLDASKLPTITSK